MKNSERLNLVALVSAALILFLILVSSAASAATEQSASSTGTYAYIANIDSNTVSVIDTATNNVSATIPVESGPNGVTITPDGKKAYVTNFYSSSVSVINTANDTVIATVPVGNEPRGIAINPDGTKVYVTNNKYGETPTISVIDTATNTVAATLDLGGHGVAVSPDGKNLYVTNYVFEGSVSVINTTTNTVTATVGVGHYPTEIVATPDGTKVYVTNADSNTVSVIDTATDTVTATLSNIRPEGMAASPDGTKVYATSYWGYTVSVIDTATNTITATVPVGETPSGVAVNPAGTKVYVTNTDYNVNPEDGGAVYVIDTATNGVTAKVPVGRGPCRVAVSLVSKPIIPVANFSSNVTKGYAPLNVKFTDLSKTATSWIWNFGDGASSTEQNPMHTFSAVGNYTVSLTATNDAGSNTTTKTDYIKVITKPVANFTSNVTSGKAPLNVAFTDTSTGIPTKWKWTFGDGMNSTQQNPIHKYSKAGNYTVALTVTNAAGSNNTTKTNYIKVIAKPVAAFSASPTSGKAPLTITFTDTSAGIPTGWKWDFGDGTTSTNQNPTHKYSKAGIYTVSLTVKNVLDSNTTTKTDYIKVVTKPVANFTSNVTSGKAPLNVAFTDTSTGIPTKWKWTFGDGMNSTQQNPIHKYSKAGNYTVALTVTNAAGSNNTTKTNYVKVK